MEESEITPTKEYLNAFNTGYHFSKMFTDAGKQMLTLLKDKTNNEGLTSTDGMVHGINQQQIEKEREISTDGLNQIKELRNKQEVEKSPDLEID